MYLDFLKFDIYIGCIKIWLTYSITVLNPSYRHKQTHLGLPSLRSAGARRAREVLQERIFAHAGLKGTTRALPHPPCPSGVSQHHSYPLSLLSFGCTAPRLSACPHQELLQPPAALQPSAGLSQQFPEEELPDELATPNSIFHPHYLILAIVTVGTVVLCLFFCTRYFLIDLLYIQAF